MKTYIALLRGINVSGHKKIKMAELRELLKTFDFHYVETYIQSGNIVFKSDEVNIKQLEIIIKNGIADKFGFDVPILVKTCDEIATILRESPFKKQEDLDANRIYYTLIHTEATNEHISSLQQEDYPNELFLITANCVYLNCTYGAGKAKLTNNVIERKLKVEATTRNHRTMLKLLELSQ